ncbi:hypothetical protein D917_10344 [Trichinella nativa]|uniref:Uncharacterized protein n=1 Tax=Trichinella nativa TaxID=6335 RepID=A0A1Y3EAR4_9BILA|nr:hypothetical protein D917_10344 [Trichinella nativa]
MATKQIHNLGRVLHSPTQSTAFKTAFEMQQPQIAGSKQSPLLFVEALECQRLPYDKYATSTESNNMSWTAHSGERNPTKRAARQLYTRNEYVKTILTCSQLMSS